VRTRGILRAGDRGAARDLRGTARRRAAKGSPPSSPIPVR
jgi:hypothetical protein